MSSEEIFFGSFKCERKERLMTACLEYAFSLQRKMDVNRMIEEMIITEGITTARVMVVVVELEE